MPSLEERLSAQFSGWEQRCRGWQLWTEPVHPEPAFEPFNGHFLDDLEGGDDGKRETILSSFARKVGEHFLGRRSALTREAPSEPVPRCLSRDGLVELQVVLPRETDYGEGFGESLLAIASGCSEPISFELVGTGKAMHILVSASEADATSIQDFLASAMPAAQVERREHFLRELIENAGPERCVIDFGLRREVLFPIADRGKGEPYAALLSALAQTDATEVVSYQVLFESARSSWSQSLLNAVTHADGSNFFVNAPEFLRATQSKVSRKLYAAVLRVAFAAESYERILQLGRNVAAALSIFDDPKGNGFIPLSNDGYEPADHLADFVNRRSRRSGMLLNAGELLSIAHVPSAKIHAPRLFDGAKSKRAPASNVGSGGLNLGSNTHLGNAVPVCVSIEERLRHVHVVGASGTGKSTLLYNMMVQDVRAGRGIALLDPHGDLCDQVLAAIPEERVEDVVLIDPADPEYAVGFNVLVAHSELERTLIASDLVSVFERLSTSWGDQLGSVLRNAILAFLESPKGGTLSDLRRFLLEPSFRESFLETVRDSEVVYYWRKAFPALSGNRSIGPVITRLETFLAPKSIRYMVSQRENRFDLGKAMDEGKIILAKLSQGTIGRENSYLLGALIVSKIQQLAMARQAQAKESRREFFLYIDEFPSFITPSLAEILSGSRKYGLGLVLAHQELRQLEKDRDVAGAVLSNCYSRVVFRVGENDARTLAASLTGFDAKDLQNLATGEAIGRIGRNDHDFNLRVDAPASLGEGAERRKEAIVAASRGKYGVKRSEVEASLAVAVERPATRSAPKIEKVEAPVPAAEPAPRVEEVRHLPVVVSETPADLGRGGVQHKAIQLRIKEKAEALGFRVHVEKRILDDAGSVDLVLERGEQAIACEITVTTTIDHEVGNISKCGKAGFRRIAAVALSPEKLTKLEAAVKMSLGAEFAARVEYFLPDAFVDHLALLPPPEPPKQIERVVHGYKVKRNYVPVSAEEARAKEEALIKHMAEQMQKKTGESPTPS
ncbi:MAG TPA: type IV secretion system DNA-binding domain-containing protein [Opitutaceae bacterium]|jgi:hypothetical protein